jgi:F-type H+-transporting ATPase subunit a
MKEEAPLLIVQWVNHLFGPAFASLLSIFGVHVPAGQEVIPMQMIMGGIVVIVLFVLSLVVRSQLSVENPGKFQQSMELVVEFLEGQLEENVGHDGHKFLPIIGTLGIFILFSNLLGLVPGLGSPTSNPNVPLGCAAVIFLYYNYAGIQKHGLGKYLKHFMGPVWWMAPLMIPIELISHLARPLSLTVRLWGNIFAEELLIGIFFTMAAFLLPLPFIAFAIFGGFLQAFIFITMSQMYLSMAVASEDH